MEHVIQTRGLSKSFGGKEVVSRIDMNVRQGEIYGFLGPNGAGKTTVLKMLTNLIKPTEGRIELFRQPMHDSSHDVFRNIGSIIELPVFYDKLTAKQNLKLHNEYMGYYDDKAIDEALEKVGLRDVEGKAVRAYSLGMKQRLGIARAIITRPKLLLLDEPVNGLDPEGIAQIRHLLRSLSSDHGTTIVISSHVLSEIEQLADTIGILSGGKLIKQVSMSDIKEEYAEYIEIVTSDRPKACAVLADVLQLSNFKAVGDDTIRIFVPTELQAKIAKSLALHDVDIESINKRYTSLEQYYLDLIGKGAG